MRFGGGALNHFAKRFKSSSSVRVDFLLSLRPNLYSHGLLLLRLRFANDPVRPGKEEPAGAGKTDRTSVLQQARETG